MRVERPASALYCHNNNYHHTFRKAVINCTTERIKMFNVPYWGTQKTVIKRVLTQQSNKTHRVVTPWNSFDIKWAPASAKFGKYDHFRMIRLSIVLNWRIGHPFFSILCYFLRPSFFLVIFWLQTEQKEMKPFIVNNNTLLVLYIVTPTFVIVK